MASSQTLTKLKRMVNESDLSLLNNILDIAEAKVLNRLYPFDDTKTEIPSRYQKNVLEIAVYLYNRIGSEGETSHSEGEFSRSYESASVPLSMLKEIVPYCGFPS